MERDGMFQKGESDMNIMIAFSAMTASVGCGLLISWLACTSLFKVLEHNAGRG